MARSAFRQGVACFEQALVAMPHLPEQRDTLAQAIDLRLALDNALLASGEPGRGFAYLREAEALATGLDDQRRLGRVYNSLIHGFWRLGDHDHALACGQRALALTAASGDVFERARAHGHLGTVYFSLGDYRLAIHALRQSMAALEGELRHQRPGMLVPSVRSRAWLVECLRERGEFAEGLTCGEEAARIAEVAGHLSSAIFTQSRLGHLLLHQGNLRRAILVLERALAHCRAADIPLFLGGITATLGLAYALAGRVAASLPLLGQAVEQVIFDAQGGGSAIVGRLGEVYLLAGRRTPSNPQSVPWRSPVTARNAATRHGAFGSSATSLLIAIPQRPNKPKLTTVRPSPWLRNSACVRSKRTATLALAGCMRRSAARSQPAPNSPPPSIYTAPWT
jgi:tetratricopeptide (TPR) repeat protein